MGIESRDYLRSDDAPRSMGGTLQGTNVVKTLIIANVVVFILQLLTAQTGLVEYWLALGPDLVTEKFQIWRLLTYAFCHSPGSIFHILMNMYILYVTGMRIQSYYGPKEFLLFYLSAAILSGLGFVLMELVLGRGGYAIGASGAVAAVFIVYAMRHPREVWLLFFVIPVQVRWLCIGFIIFDLHPVLLELAGEEARSGVAHAAHLGGYLFGFLYERNHWHLSGLISGVSTHKYKLPRRRSHLKVYSPEDEPGNLEARVDELLQKVHEHGEASLTDAERAFLADASRRYRTRL
ncbi:MAG: rhomboid family intramembrane serine protease [Planctomycetaceae bacterium]|nr:rhomboid family intramembrane serine protease [Planctomycetaceae bacterium]